MYGGTHKFGRGGGGGGGHRGGGSHNKRNSFPPPPQRPSSTSNHRNKLPSRNNNNNKTSLTSIPPSSTNSSPPQSEESFSLISGDPPAFAAIIRLAPDLVDEIKRAESLNVPPQIKFNSNPNNTSGNVIDVGGKEFRFTWSDDMGGLCDIYEERQNGEDGNGLLVESGCSWRKLNVQRVLDESTKKHVKKRSEEYEQKLKSRKAIVLDQCNPSMKSQMQALAAAEASPWKFKPKNKRYFEASQAVGHPKPVKSSTGVSSASSAKGRHSTSPLPSPHKASAFVRGNAIESQTVAEIPTTNHARAKENAVSSENETHAQVSGRMLDVPMQRENQGAMSDLQNVLVKLLKDNPKGMSIKALEKAVGDMISNSAGKVEPILKKIATYEPPGRYMLRPGVELETSKKSYTDSGSPDDNNQKQYVPNDNHGEVPALDIDIAGKFPAEYSEEHVQKPDEELNTVDKYDASQHFSDLFGDDEPPNRSEQQTARTNGSESGSDSDSGSSDSGSDSASRSRSPAGSGSASSSDSEDSSSNSKEASDVDVNIMSDDDKEPKKLQGSEHGLSAAPIPWSMPEAMPPQDGTVGDQNGYVSEDIDIDIENDFLDDDEGQLATAPHNTVITTERLRNISPDHDQNQLCDKIDVIDEKEDAEDELQHKHHSFVKSGGKFKRGSTVIQFEHDDNDAKRFKANTAQLSNSRHSGSRTLGSPSKLSADVANEDNHESHNLLISNELNRDDSANVLFGAQKGYNYNVSGKSAVESIQSDRKSHSYNIEAADKVVKNAPNFGNPPNLGADSKFMEMNAYTEGFSKHEDKGYRDAQDEEDSSVGKVNGRIKESSLDQKRSYTEAHFKKHGERVKKSHSLGTSKLQSGPSLNNGVKADFNSPVDRRRLQRESSDLELGELREPLSEEPEGTKRQFERGGSFKHLDTKLGSLGSRNAELKGKPVTKPILESVNTSSPIARGAPNNADSSSRRRSPEPNAEDSSQPHGVLQDELQQSRSGPAGVRSLSNKAVDRSKLGHNEVVANQGTDVEGYGETQKKSHVKSQHEDSRKESSSRKGRGNKSKKSNVSKENSDRRKEMSHGQGHNNKRKRRESSSDENTLYSKYEKEEPELKGPIKSFSQYKEYVQEYREKYESYCSLNKILESYRNEFQKMGMDLDNAKGRDTERYFGILAQLRDSYRRCGMRHKRLKKIFIVLHEELKQLKQMIKDFAVDYIKE